MTNNIQIVPYDPARKAEVAELLNICLGEKATGCRDEAYWTWKHEQNPFGQSVMLLAECDDRLVGVRAFMRWRLIAGGQVVEAAKPVDTVTHPEYQRRGIFSRLTSQACEDARNTGIQLIFNTPNQNSKPGYLKLGWQPVADLPFYAKWLRPASAVWHAVRPKFGTAVPPTPEAFFRETPRTAVEVFQADAQLTPLLEGRNRVNDASAVHSPTSLTRELRVDGESDRQISEPSQAPSPAVGASDPPGGGVEQAGRTRQPEACPVADVARRIENHSLASVGNSVDRLQTQRDLPFMKWRYSQHPHIPYYAEVAGTDAKPDGVLFYRTNLRMGLREIMINDLLTREGDVETQTALLHQLCSRVDAHYVVAHAAEETPLLASFRRLGFRRVPRRRITLVARSLTEGVEPNPFQGANWSLCLGDIEGL